MSALKAVRPSETSRFPVPTNLKYSAVPSVRHHRQLPDHTVLPCAHARTSRAVGPVMLTAPYRNVELATAKCRARLLHFRNPSRGNTMHQDVVLFGWLEGASEANCGAPPAPARQTLSYQAACMELVRATHSCFGAKCFGSRAAPSITGGSHWQQNHFPKP
jgi:hypothetical protein